MNTIHLLTLTFAASLVAAAETNLITDIRVGLSPFYSDSDRSRVRQALTKFTLDAPPGTRVTCDDAYNLETIAVLTVPALRFDSPGNRARILAEPLAALTVWFGRTNAPAAPAEVRSSAALRVPELLQQVSVQGSDHAR